MVANPTAVGSSTEARGTAPSRRRCRPHGQFPSIRPGGAIESMDERAATNVRSAVGTDRVAGDLTARATAFESRENEPDRIPLFRNIFHCEHGIAASAEEVQNLISEARFAATPYPRNVSELVRLPPAHHLVGYTLNGPCRLHPAWFRGADGRCTGRCCQRQSKSSPAAGTGRAVDAQMCSGRPLVDSTPKPGG